LNTVSLYTKIKQLVTNFQVVIIPTDNKRPHSRAGRTIKPFWMTPPTQTQLDAWFADNEVKSYAVLCGKISGNLFLLDFDDKKEYRNFKQQFPQIAKTLTVRTRRGYHVYLRSEKTVSAQKIRGGDLLGEGTYAIGPGSIIKQRRYVIDTHQSIYQLQANELEQLLQKLRLSTRSYNKPTQQTNQPCQSSETTSQTIIRQFQILAPKQGRNKALYQVANTAHALKIPLLCIKHALSQAYAQEKAHWNHAPETQQSRLKEAERTLKSAYRNKKAKIPTNRTINIGRLPTAIREEILKKSASKNKQGLLVKSSSTPGRLLEALLLEGTKIGETFTIKEAQEIGSKYNLSAKGIYQVLRQEKGITPTGERLFRIVKYHPPVGETDKGTIKEHYSDADIDNRMPFSEQSTSAVRTRGRQTQFMFVMPSIEELCDMYNVIPQSWDDLDASDLMSAKAYKEAIHREYVRRVAPEQSVTYMANRLGCHPRSIYRYDASLNVQVTPIFGFTPLNWTNVDNPDFYSETYCNHVTPGQWLQRVDGKRFPALKGIAITQLAQGNTLVACERRPSRRLLSPALSPLFDVIWRRADLPVGEWDVGGDAYKLPAFGPDITPFTRQPAGKISKPITSCDREHALKPEIRSGVKPRPLDMPLIIIPGIGKSRCDQLFDLGIFSLSELAKANAQSLAAVSWYGGYVTLKTILHWQEEAAIRLGWQERDPQVVKREYHQRVYRQNFTTLIKFVRRVFRVIDGILPIEDLTTIEPTRTQLRLEHINNEFKQDKSLFYADFRMAEVNQMASCFFDFYRAYIKNFLALRHWELEEYGLGDPSFWKKELACLDRIAIKFQVDALVDV
jgi:hypothetical protein